MLIKNSQIIKSSGFRIFQTLVGVIIGFVMMPFLIKTLGNELYGLWIVIASVVGSYYLLDFGLVQGVTRFVARAIQADDTEDANQTINTALVIYAILGCLIFIISVLIAGLFVDHFVDAQEKVSLVQILLIIAGLSIGLEFPAKAFPGVISAYMRYDIISVVRLIKTCIDALLIYLLLSNGYGLIAMAISTFFTSLTSTLMFVIVSKKLFLDLKIERQYVNKDIFKSLFKFSKWVFIVDLSNMLREKMDIWLIAFLMSSSVLTVYYVAVRLIDFSLQFLSQATGITAPLFMQHYTSGDQAKLNKAVIAFLKINFLLSSIFIAGFYVVGDSFIRLWMGDTFQWQETWSCLLVLAIGRFCIYLMAPLQSFLMTINRHSITAGLALVETFAVGSLLWLLIPIYGINGAAIAVTFPAILLKLFILPIWVSACCQLSLKDYFFRAIIFSTLSLTILYLLKPLLGESGTISAVNFIWICPLIAALQIGCSIILFNKIEIHWLFKRLGNLASQRNHNDPSASS